MEAKENVQQSDSPQPLTEEEKTQLKKLSLALSKSCDRFDKNSVQINSKKAKIVLLRAQIKALRSQRHNLNDRRRLLWRKFSAIEKDRTCYGCCNAECKIPHEEFSPRCKDYNELPF